MWLKVNLCISLVRLKIFVIVMIWYKGVKVIKDGEIWYRLWIVNFRNLDVY